MAKERTARSRAQFPTWGALALPAAALWGTVLGFFIGAFFGNAATGTAIGAGLGVGIGLTLLAAAIVIASAKV